MQRIVYGLAAAALGLGLAAGTLAQPQPPKKPAAPKPQTQPQPKPAAPAKTLKCPICRNMDMTLEKTAKTPRAFKLGDQTWYCCDNEKCARGMAALDQYLKNKKKKP
jgi:hypothetical protein